MEIQYPDIRCELSPNHAHYFTPVTPTIWRCRHCWVVVWLPTVWEDCTRFSSDIVRIGLEKAYQKHLQGKPLVRRILKKLEEIRLLRKALTDEELMIAISAIVTSTEKDFTDWRIPDRKEEKQWQI